MISIIVATAQKGVIGKSGALPWYLPADLAHFKSTTMGHPIIMGRVTHESIGKALPGRRNIVISSQPDYQAEACEVVESLGAALTLVKSEAEAFIIGGESIYKLALPLADKIYLTRVHTEIPGDKYFRYDAQLWHQSSIDKHQADDNNPYDYDFVELLKSR